MSYWPKIIDSDLSPHQQENLARATAKRIGLLTGGPGTGKTWTIARQVKACIEECGAHQIAICGPTGKSAVRVTEMMNGYGINLTARTIHSLLRVESSDGGWSFAHNRSNPLPLRYLIVDEGSMPCVDVMAALLAARPRGCSVLIVGDVNQLPPVGHGAPLRDMIAAGVPYGELREIKRNDGGIVQACADIRDGKPFKCEGNLRLVECHDTGRQQQAMIATVDKSAREFGIDPVWGVQVLCAVNKSGDLSRKALNKLLQNHLNPNPAIKNSSFRLADKVVNTKNTWLPLVEISERKNGRVVLVTDNDDVEKNDRNQVYVANGELGQVVRIEPKYLHVQLTAPRRLVVVPLGAQQPQKEEPAGDEDGNPTDESTGTGCDWDLGYALSVHKSQGSEWPVVLYMVDEGAKRLCTREHIYTGISRAKQCCYLIGKLSVAHGFCRKTAIDKRRTFLKQLIEQGVAKL